jgi:hypothetical protein
MCQNTSSLARSVVGAVPAVLFRLRKKEKSISNIILHVKIQSNLYVSTTLGPEKSGSFSEEVVIQRVGIHF